MLVIFLSVLLDSVFSWLSNVHVITVCLYFLPFSFFFQPPLACCIGLYFGIFLHLIALGFPMESVTPSSFSNIKCLLSHTRPVVICKFLNIFYICCTFWGQTFRAHYPMGSDTLRICIT